LISTSIVLLLVIMICRDSDWRYRIFIYKEDEPIEFKNIFDRKGANARKRKKVGRVSMIIALLVAVTLISKK